MGGGSHFAKKIDVQVRARAPKKERFVLISVRGGKGKRKGNRAMSESRVLGREESETSPMIRGKYPSPQKKGINVKKAMGECLSDQTRDKEDLKGLSSVSCSR